MPEADTPASAVAHLIQLAIAPVFLLAGVGAILNVVTNRLARVVDRTRRLEAEFAALPEADRRLARWELGRLGVRMKLVNGAITACTACALFVCLVVATLFVSDLVRWDLSRVVVFLFISAMALLITGLLLFLGEVRMASRTLRVRWERLEPSEGGEA